MEPDRVQHAQRCGTRRAQRELLPAPDGSALFGAGIAGLPFAAGAQAQTENEQRYEIDQRLHIIYYSPEAFGCVSANNAKNIAAAISKTQAEIRLIQSELAAFPPINSGLSADDSTYVASLTGISVHLSNILSRLGALPPCRVELQRAAAG